MYVSLKLKFHFGNEWQVFKLHLFDMSFESRFLRSKKQDHCVKEKICLYVIMSKKYVTDFQPVGW